MFTICMQYVIMKKPELLRRGEDMIKKEMIAMLLAGGQGSRLGVLTAKVAKPAVAFGGKYRIIDFPLSNCINSGIDTVGVLTQYQPLRLNTHIGIGIPWDLDRNIGGVSILPPYEKSTSSEWYTGTANAIYQNLEYMETFNPDYVLILSGDHIYKMDYEVMLDFHKENHADVTIAAMPVPIEDVQQQGSKRDKRQKYLRTCAIMFCVNVTAATVVSIFMVIYLMACGLMYFYMRPRIMSGIVEFASNYSQVQKQLLYNLSVPYCLLDNNGNVMWTNKAMQDCLGIKRDFRKNINTVIPEVTPSIFPDSEIGFKEIRLTFQDRDYKAELKNIDADFIAEGVDIIEKSMDSSMYVMYLFDETDINTYIQKLKDERFVVGLVYIDNYEEALDSTDDVRRSLLAGLIDKRVNKYFSPGSISLATSLIL